MAVNNGDTDTIDVERVASSIGLAMSQDLFMAPKRCIFKTPIALYRQNEKAYIPDGFSIGPLHHGHPNLKATETIKAKYLLGLISRSHFSNTMLKDLINSINALESEAREYYAGPIGYSREEFVKILIIDGCFIIELFCKCASKQLREENDPIFSMSSMRQILGHDLILLENQVPWMVLEHLFRMILAPVSKMTLIELAIAFFRDILVIRVSAKSDHLQDIKHIPDLLKKWVVSSIEAVDEEMISPQSGWEIVPTVTRLVEAGIKLRKSRSRNILDIKFKNGALEIPPIRINETTETFFRNLISFEQCYPNSDDRITSYVIFLDNLINTVKDVEILCEKDILFNWLNPEDAAQFFNKLYRDICIQTYYHAKLGKQVKEYCERRWPRWHAVFVRNYFNTPWAFLSTLGAVILLILSFLQTLYTMKC